MPTYLHTIASSFVHSRALLCRKALGPRGGRLAHSAHSALTSAPTVNLQFYYNLIFNATSTTQQTIGLTMLLLIVVALYAIPTINDIFCAPTACWLVALTLVGVRYSKFYFIAGETSLLPFKAALSLLLLFLLLVYCCFRCLLPRWLLPRLAAQTFVSS